MFTDPLNLVRRRLENQLTAPAVAAAACRLLLEGLQTFLLL